MVMVVDAQMTELLMDVPMHERMGPQAVLGVVAEARGNPAV